MSYLTIAISVLGALVSIYQTFWSASAQLKTLQLKLADLHARQATEAQRLEATYARIAREHADAGQALVDRLNQSVEDLRR